MTSNPPDGVTQGPTGSHQPPHSVPAHNAMPPGSYPGPPSQP